MWSLSRGDARDTCNEVVAAPHQRAPTWGTAAALRGTRVRGCRAYTSALTQIASIPAGPRSRGAQGAGPTASTNGAAKVKQRDTMDDILGVASAARIDPLAWAPAAPPA